jgi:hypothetical protein
MIIKFVIVPGILPVQQVTANGWSNVQGVPHCTVLLVGQYNCRQGVGGQHPTTVTVWLQLVLFPQPSAIYHVWVMLTLGQTPFVTNPADATNTFVGTPAEVTN